ncbi:MAG: TetR/AcrR family transcriptional regulator [Mycobacteriales bacterium]
MSGSTGSRGRGLSLDSIVATTIELIDDAGLDAASMRGVAARLDVDPMSLYRHVADREDLMDHVVDHVISELAQDPDLLDAPDGWRDYLARLARGIRRFAVAHPHAFPLIATRPRQAPWAEPPLRSLRWIEAMLSRLVQEGFTVEHVLFAYRTFNTFLVGFLLLETGSMTTSDPGPAGSRRRRDPTGGIDAEDYPTLHRLAGRLADSHYDDEFELAMQAMLDRITAEITPAARGRRRPSSTL